MYFSGQLSSGTCMSSLANRKYKEYMIIIKEWYIRIENSTRPTLAESSIVKVSVTNKVKNVCPNAIHHTPNNNNFDN